MKTVCFAMQKGGIGKTSTTCAVGHCLNDHGKSVLLLDLDPQQNLCFLEGVDVLSEDGTLYEVWAGHKKSIAEVIQPIQLGLDLVRGGFKLSAADFEFSGRAGREQMLSRCLGEIQDRYDYILIDCPPSLNLMTMMGMTAADEIIIPCGVDALSVQGLLQIYTFIDDIKTYCNPELIVTGILLTMYDADALVTRSLESTIKEIADSQGTVLFDTRIHYSKTIKTYTAKQDTSVFQKKFKAAADYRMFTKELLKMWEGGKG